MFGNIGNPSDIRFGACRLPGQDGAILTEVGHEKMEIIEGNTRRLAGIFFTFHRLRTTDCPEQ
jgi:hypothetical protein